MMRRFLVPLYGLRIYMSDSEAEVRAYLKRHGGDPSDCNKALGLTPCWNDAKGDRHRIMAAWDGNLGTLVHECIHMSWEIIGASGVQIDQDNNEPQAYITDWLFTTFCRCFPSFQVKKAG